MTEQELREKIIETLEKGGRNFLKSKETNVSIYEYYADALITAGLTFDKTTAILAKRTNGKTLILKARYYNQMKHRAEIAERAARDLIAYYCGYTIQKDIDNSLRIALLQAEQELAEEKKND